MITQFFLIFAINYLSVVFVELTNFPIPGTILALILLFFLLATKILKVEKIEIAASILLSNMIIMFLPPAIKIIENFSMLKSDLIKILTLLITTTFLTIIATASTVQLTIKIMEKKNERKSK